MSEGNEGQGQEQEFVPKSKYEDLRIRLVNLEQVYDNVLKENIQLRDANIALTKSAGFHKASEMQPTTTTEAQTTEGIAQTNDQRIIGGILMDLLKLRRAGGKVGSIIVRFKGNEILAIEGLK